MQSAVNKKQKIGIWICISLVVGNMVGSGIFLLPASLAPYGGVSLVGWVATAIGALMTALVFVRLSRQFPKQGGPYRYAYDHFGDFAGFSVAWSYWISIWCGNAAIAVAAVAYLAYFYPSINQNPMMAIGISLFFIWSLTLLNAQGVRKAGIFQLVSTLLKLLPLIALGAVSFFVFDVEAFKPFNLTDKPLSDAVTATAALTLWAFLGLESATIPADNVENPKKTIPKATIYGLLIVAFVYISSQVTIMSVVSNADLQHSSAPYADAAKALWGEWAGFIVAAGAIISCLGALNGWILLQGQVPMTAARDGLMPKFLTDSKQDGVSMGALVLSSVLISVLVIFNFSEGLVSLYTFAILVSTLGIFVPYLLSIVVDIKLAFSKERELDFFSFNHLLVCLFYIIWAISGIGSKAMLWGVVLILSGLPIYWWVKTRRV
ncbi:MAG: amino acid permease [Enterobacterales bacterium]|nr:amino acid permease [Enterobacterales bacterium]